MRGARILAEPGGLCLTLNVALRQLENLSFFFFSNKSYARHLRFYRFIASGFLLLSVESSCKHLVKSRLTFRTCLHEGGGLQVGEVTRSRSRHLSCKRDQIKMRDYMDRRVTPPKLVTSPTWGPPPPCKQAIRRKVPCIYSIFVT